jgi:hypothetical protein
MPIKLNYRRGSEYHLCADNGLAMLDGIEVTLDE